MSVRDKVISLGKFWAAPNPYRPTPDELVGFFTGAGCSQAPTRKDAARVLADAAYDSYSTGVPIFGQTKHWCGIFAAYCIRASGWSNVRWDLTSGGMPALSKYSDYDVTPGDIGIVQGTTQHHVIITAVSDGRVWTVEGNTGGQKIIENTRPLSQISKYYYLDW
jgi:hypothetical protein